jgi:hypothetical protein
LDGKKRCSCGDGCHSFGACLRGKRLRVVVGDSHEITSQWDSDLDRYEWAHRQGIQPASTMRDAVETAIAVSNATGVPYRAD